MSKRLLIAVDGPAASGKGTLANRLAAHYGLPHLDTGSLYRAVGKKTLALKQARLGSTAPLTAWNEAEPEATDTLFAIEAARNLHGEDITAPGLHEEGIGQAASIVSAIPEVRMALLNYQRHFAAQLGGAVLDGRDIGTVICPDADVKLYITASADVRAKRRYQQQLSVDPAVQYDGILADITARDLRDSTRTTAPLKLAEDAITLDTSNMTIDEVFTQAVKIIEQGKSLSKSSRGR